MDIMAKRHFTYPEASKFLGISLPTLYSKVCRKEIPHIRLSGRMVRFDPEKLQAWLDARSVEPKAE